MRKLIIHKVKNLSNREKLGKKIEIIKKYLKRIRFFIYLILT